MEVDIMRVRYDIQIIVPGYREDGKRTSTLSACYQPVNEAERVSPRLGRTVPQRHRGLPELARREVRC